MTLLKNYLEEKNISVKDFAKITKVKEKKLNAILENKSFFNDDEADRVAAFLGVSKYEFYRGVVERKGELPEVAEQNNLNHFRYYIKTRLKNARILFKCLDFVGGFSFFGVCILYILLIFAGITGLPTLLKSVEVLLPCVVVPVCGIMCLADIAKARIIEKNVTPDGKITIETIGVSLLLMVFAISAYCNDFTPVTSLVLTIVGAIAFSVISIASPFKNKPLTNRFLQLVACMLPTVLLIISYVFTYKYVVSITPAEEGMAGEALATAADIINMIYGLIIFIVFYISLVYHYSVFVKGTGKLFMPFKKLRSITKGKLATFIIGWVIVASVLFLSVWVSQGVYLKYIYTNVLGEYEEALNWKADFITDFDEQFKKGEYDIVEYEGMNIKIPKGYKLDKETDYSIVYKKDEQNSIIFSKPINSGLENSDYAEEALTPEQRELIESCFIEEYGFYPHTMYEWHKIMGMVTPADIDIFNSQKTVVLYTVLTMKAIATTNDFSYYLYENDGLYASITSHVVENNETGNRDAVIISFGSMDLEYTIMFTNPVQDEAETVDRIEKILNSIEQSKSTK